MLLNKHNLWDPPSAAIRLITLQRREGIGMYMFSAVPQVNLPSGSCHSLGSSSSRPTTPLFSVWWRIYPTTPGVYRLGITDFHSIPSLPPQISYSSISGYILPSPSWSGCFLVFCFFLTRVMCLPFISSSFVPLWGLQEHHFSDSFFLAYACFGIVSISVVCLLLLPGRR